MSKLTILSVMFCVGPVGSCVLVTTVSLLVSSESSASASLVPVCVTRLCPCLCPCPRLNPGLLVVYNSDDFLLEAVKPD